jgi:hypothetical protein
LYAGTVEGVENVNDENPIIEEIRQAREQLLARHNGDLDSLVTELQVLSAARIRAGGSALVPSELPNPHQSSPTKKVA